MSTKFMYNTIFEEGELYRLSLLCPFPSIDITNPDSSQYKVMKRIYPGDIIFMIRKLFPDNKQQYFKVMVDGIVGNVSIPIWWLINIK